MSSGVEQAALAASTLPVGLEAAASRDPARFGFGALDLDVASVAAELVAVMLLHHLDRLAGAAGERCAQEQES